MRLFFSSEKNTIIHGVFLIPDIDKTLFFCSTDTIAILPPRGHVATKKRGRSRGTRRRVASPDAAALTYKIISISLYVADIERAARIVAVLKSRGHSKANRSSVIRWAIARLNGVTPALRVSLVGQKYKIVSISEYHEVIAEMDRMVAELEQADPTASRSALIRTALELAEEALETETLGRHAFA